MMKGLKKSNKKRFEYYLRQCRDCDTLYQSQTRKSKYCHTCKRIRIIRRIENSMSTRGILIREGFKLVDKLIEEKNKEVKNDSSKLYSKSKYFI